MTVRVPTSSLRRSSFSRILLDADRGSADSSKINHLLFS